MWMFQLDFNVKMRACVCVCTDCKRNHPLISEINPAIFFFLLLLFLFTHQIFIFIYYSTSHGIIISKRKKPYSKWLALAMNLHCAATVFC